MSFYIYGLRLRGDHHCRYIGMTAFTPKRRLTELNGAASERRKSSRYSPDGLSAWLLDNKGNVEAFKIAKAETAAEARMTERTIITLALQLGLKLLNVQHVPDDQRIGYIPTGWSQRRQAQAAA